MQTYSHSALSCFENCPHAFKLRYRDKIRVDVDTIERFLGHTVHSTLEHIYKDAAAGNKRELKDATGLFRWYWKKDFKDSIIIVKKQYNADRYKDEGEKAVKRYFEKHFPFDKNKVLGLETRLSIRLDKEGKYVMSGVIDRLEETKEGDIEIHDYKTGMTMPSEKDINSDRQLPLYQIGVRSLYGDEMTLVERVPEKKWGTQLNIFDAEVQTKRKRKFTLVWHYLMFGHEFTVNKTETELNAITDETKKEIDIVESAADFPKKKGPLCNYCDYFIAKKCDPNQ